MMAEKFSVPELTALRSELLHGFDSKDAAEMLQMLSLIHIFAAVYGAVVNAALATPTLGMIQNFLRK